jgi:predicted RNase H-like HicB family nuclease
VIEWAVWPRGRAAGVDRDMMQRQLELTAVFRKVPGGYIGFPLELPGANTQGATLAETRINLREAIQLVLEANCALAERDLAGQEVIREPIRVPAE